MRYHLPFLMLAAASAAVCSGQTEHRHLMLIVSKGLPGVTIYDADTEQPICRAKVGVSPHEATFSLDGKYVYVPVYGSSGVGKPGTDEHLIHFIRTSDCSEVGTLDTGNDRRPHSIHVGKSGLIYVTAETGKTVLVVNADQRKIVGKIPTDSATSHMLAITPDEKTGYTSNVQSQTVSVLDLKNRKLEKVIPTGAENQRMAISPDGKWFVTSLGPEHKIAFYRTSDNQLDFTIPVDGVPFVAAFSKDGKYVYDAGSQGKEIRVWKIDLGTKKVVATSTEAMGTNLGSMAVDPLNGTVYVSDQATSQITEIDPATWQVKKKFTADKTPDCMAWTTVR